MGSAQEAARLAWDLWRIFAPLNPVIGFLNRINWDKGHQFMLEFTRASVLQHPAIKNNIGWVLLVALGRAMVVTNPKTYNKNDLDEFVKLAVQT